MTRIHESWRQVSSLPAKGNELDGERWRQWKATAASSGHAELIRELEDCGPLHTLLEQACSGSPFIAKCLAADVNFVQKLLLNGADDSLAACLAHVSSAPQQATETQNEIMNRLRRCKQNAALTIALAEIAGSWPTMKLAEACTSFAKAALGAAVQHLLAQAHEKGGIELPDLAKPEQGSGLTVIGMGKFGAGELNYSSDIDIIILFDDAIAPVADGAHQRIFSKFARDLVALMSKRTADGYVFRTDLRLRPDPSSTPPAVSLRAACEYYATVGQTWERAAMIKASAVAGDLAVGEKFLESVRPFIWRRNLDFAAMRGIRSIKRQIDAHKGSGSGMEGRSVKLGRGGIREIEFFVQAQQLVWGGKAEELRGSATLGMLDALCKAQHVTKQTAADLKDAYLYLRRVEHRLQMVDDRQTHSLPEDQQGMERFAGFLGLQDSKTFLEILSKHLATVERHYDGLFETPAPAGDDLFEKITGSADDAIAAMRDLGFADPDGAVATVRKWPTSRLALLAEIGTHLLRAFGATAEPDTALNGFAQFLETQPNANNTIELLAARPELIELVAEVMGAAPRLTSWIQREPELVETALQREFSDLSLPDDLGLEPAMLESARRGLVRVYYALDNDCQAMTEDLSASISQLPVLETDMQPVLDLQRTWRRQTMFLLGCHMLRGYLSPVEAALPLGNIAQACLASLIPVIEARFQAVHGHIAGGMMAVIAFGKFGSREMTFASDLDLIFVYDHDPDAAMSDGSKPLAPTQYFARLSRRIINAIVARTTEGPLYEVDMRLRPSGKSGPIACSFAAFESYQMTQAWTWELQALTRARVIYCEGELDNRLNAAIRTALLRERCASGLARDIGEMRQRIRDDQKGASAMNIKNRPGGLLDLEFIAQFIQLRHAYQHPDILQKDAHSVLIRAGQLGLMDNSDAQHLAETVMFWRNLHGMLILSGGDGDDLTLSIRRAAGRTCGVDLISSLETATQDAADRVADAFDQLIRA